MRRSRHDEPVLITTAPESADDEYDRRRKRYAIMMAGRALAVIAAALTYKYSLVLALGFVVAGGILPWSAVIMANDRPPKKRQGPAYGVPNTERALSSRSHEVFDAEQMEESADAPEHEGRGTSP
jgi:DUF3099 family protein